MDKHYQKLLSGDFNALRKFYQETRPKLCSWVQQRVSEVADVEEIVQDVYLAFVDSLPVFQGNSSLWTFLIGIAKHEVADYWRKQYAKKAIRTVPFVDEIYTEQLYSSKEVSQVLEKVYEKLVPEDRVILIWKYEERQSIKEIASRLAIGVKAAESRLFRARAAFKLVFNELYE